MINPLLLPEAKALSASAATTLSAKVDDVFDERDEAQRDRDAARGQVVDLRAAVAAHEGTIANLTRERDRVRALADQLDRALADARLEVAAVKAERDKAQRDIDGARAAWSKSNWPLSDEDGRWLAQAAMAEAIALIAEVQATEEGSGYVEAARHLARRGGR